jgi:nitroreductase
MDLYSAIDQRRTIRDFDDRQVDPDIISRILEAGLKAPTNDHLRNWEFIVISDKQEKATIVGNIFKDISKEQVAGIIENWNMTDDCQIGMYMDAIPKQYSMLYHAGCIVLPFFKQSQPLLEPETLSSLNPFASIWLCIENILLAATAEGLGVSLRIPSGKELDYLREVVHYPEDYYMPCYLGIGYPAKDAVIIPQKKFDIKDKIHINQW